MINKPNAYKITPEHFDRARADIARRREEMNDRLNLELADINAFETASADFAARYPEDAASPVSTVAASIAEEGKRLGILHVPTVAELKGQIKIAGRKARPANAGRPYKPKEDDQIAAAERGQLKQLAQELGRGYDGVLKHHEVLLKRRKPEKTDTAPEPAPEMEKPQDETVYLSGSQQQILHRALRASTRPLPEQPDTPALDPADTPRLNYNLDPGTPFKEPPKSAEGARESTAHTEPDWQNETDKVVAAQAGIMEAAHDPNHPDHEKAKRLAGIDPSSSEKPEIVEPTQAPDAARPPGVAAGLRELAEADGRRARLPPAKPGISVTGRLMDNGPADQRVYGAGWSRSE